MEEFAVGDRVVICTVDEMIESGLFDYYPTARDIILEPTHNRLDLGFNKRMQYLCGQIGVISQIEKRYTATEIKIEFDDPSITLERENDHRTWHITPGMVKHYTPAVSDGDIISFLNEF